MHFEDTVKLDESPEVVWALLNDPGVLIRAIPGLKPLELISPDQYTATFQVKMGTC